MKNLFKEIFNTVIYLAVIFVMTYLFITFVAQRTKVDGMSMESTLHDEDSLLIEKISYRFGDPKRFDIVVFPYSDEYTDEVYFIKRVIGLPGERVRIDYDGNIYINDQILEENYGKEVIADPGRAAEEIVLGEDEYFVMGDNRNNSKDGRDPSVGNIKKSDFLGRAFFRIYPFSDFGSIK
ncbi:MAG: signal peptidase I [Butyrivibrio sp.]|nr:signal peptidase I [Butyrivibrio sp.]